MIVDPQSGSTFTFNNGWDSLLPPTQEVESEPADNAGVSISSVKSTINWDEILDKEFIFNPDFSEAVENSEKFFDDQGNLEVGLSEDERIMNRVAMCGKFFTTGVSWQNGTAMTSNPWFCGDFRHCSHCLQVRADKFQDEIIDIKSKITNLYVISSIDKAKSLELRRSLGKDNFKCLPQENGNDFILCCEVEGVNLEQYDAELVDARILSELDYKQIVMTPKGRKCSGGLTKSLNKPVAPKAEEPDKKDKILGMTAFVIPDSKLERDTWAKTIAETSDLDPQTPAELQYAILKRTNLFVSNYRAAGGTVKCTKLVSIYVTMSKVDWKTPIPELDLPRSP